jgi:hypothetical protein
VVICRGRQHVPCESDHASNLGHSWTELLGHWSIWHRASWEVKGVWGLGMFQDCALHIFHAEQPALVGSFLLLGESVVLRPLASPSLLIVQSRWTCVQSSCMCAQSSCMCAQDRACCRSVHVSLCLQLGMCLGMITYQYVFLTLPLSLAWNHYGVPAVLGLLTAFWMSWGTCLDDVHVARMLPADVCRSPLQGLGWLWVQKVSLTMCQAASLCICRKVTAAVGYERSGLTSTAH